MSDSRAGAGGDPTGEARRVFSDDVRVQRMLDVEVALARALAAHGLVPARAVEAIAAAARVERFDLSALASDARTAGNLAIPLVRALTSLVERAEPESAGFVHWGATSQDIIDTGLVLQIRDAIPLVLGNVRRAAVAAATHARMYADTPMAGRTWLQQSTPITFGLKAAGWLDALVRAAEGLGDAGDAAMVVQCGGASGTLAALGDNGIEVASTLGRILDLRVPAVPWHAHRDRLATLACALGVLCGTLGKIARDVALLGQTEVNEVTEGSPGGSSTMPHKQNPVQASQVLAAAIRAPGLVATMLAALPQEHERGAGGWLAEWDTLPELVILTADAAAACAGMLEHLRIHPGAMRANLDMTRGLIMAEAVMMRLAPHVGKSVAHRVVTDAARRAVDEQRDFGDVLSDDPRVLRWLSPDAVRAALAPDTYLGAATQFVGRVLAETGTYTGLQGPTT